MDIVYHLARRHFGPHSTIGDISTPDGTHLAFTCEDVVREPSAGHPATVDSGALAAWVKSWKVFGRTAIPLRALSPRLDALYPVRAAHAGTPLRPRIRWNPHPSRNTEADTEGCILPGLSIMDREAVGNSKMAVAKLEALICPQLEAGHHVYLDIAKGLEIQ